MTLYEVVWLLFVNGLYMTYLVKKVGHISYVVNPGWESSRIQVEDMSYECLFFDRGQIILDITFFDLRDTALYSIIESGSRDVVRLCNTLNRHFLIYTNNLNSKENSDFLRLRVYYIVVL